AIVGTSTTPIVGTSTTPIVYGGTSPTGAYTGANLNVRFTTGDAIRFRGAGSADVPAFDVSVTASDLVELDPPWFTTKVTIDTSTDLALSWGAATRGDAMFTIGDGVGHTLACAFDATVRRATVPKANLAAMKLLVGDAPVNATFYVATRAEVDVPGWRILALAIVWFGANFSQSGAIVLR
ncbi:MAG: hypothetical protein ACHREM_24680, partial [Polyangiales bacterium]